MGNASERGFDASYDNRNIRIYFLQYLRIDRHSIIGTLTGFALRSVCIIRTESLCRCIMVYHRIHGTAVYSEVQSRGSQLAEVAKIVPPVRLRYNGHSISIFLQPSCNHCSTERRMIDEGVTRKKDDVYVIPS